MFEDMSSSDGKPNVDHYAIIKSCYILSIFSKYDEHQHRHTGDLDQHTGFLFRNAAYSRRDVPSKMF
jgi:hypothetical protein